MNLAWTWFQFSEIARNVKTINGNFPHLSWIWVKILSISVWFHVKCWNYLNRKLVTILKGLFRFGILYTLMANLGVTIQKGGFIMVHYESSPYFIFRSQVKIPSLFFFIITKMSLRSLYVQTFFRFKSTIFQDKVTDYCTWSWRCRISDCVRPDQQRGGKSVS